MECKELHRILLDNIDKRSYEEINELVYEHKCNCPYCSDKSTISVNDSSYEQQPTPQKTSAKKLVFIISASVLAVIILMVMLVVSKNNLFHTIINEDEEFSIDNDDVFSQIAYANEKIAYDYGISEDDATVNIEELYFDIYGRVINIYYEVFYEDFAYAVSIQPTETNSLAICNVGLRSNNDDESGEIEFGTFAEYFDILEWDDFNDNANEIEYTSYRMRRLEVISADDPLYSDYFIAYYRDDDEILSTYDIDIYAKGHNCMLIRMNPTMNYVLLVFD